MTLGDDLPRRVPVRADHAVRDVALMAFPQISLGAAVVTLRCCSWLTGASRPRARRARSTRARRAGSAGASRASFRSAANSWSARALSPSFLVEHGLAHACLGARVVVRERRVLLQSGAPSRRSPRAARIEEVAVRGAKSRDSSRAESRALRSSPCAGLPRIARSPAPARSWGRPRTGPCAPAVQTRIASS